MRGDYIFVKNLLAKAVVGRDAWKRSISQPIRISLGINVGSRLIRMGLTDDLRRTLNYDSLSTTILEQVETQKHDSAEQLAASVSQIIQSRLSTGEFANVTVSQEKARLLIDSIDTTMNKKSKLVNEKVRGLNLPTIIGVNDLERLNNQIVEVDIEVDREPNEEVFSHEFVQEISENLGKSKFLTIESYANKLAELICAQPHVHKAIVRAGKPSALNWAESAQIQVERTGLPITSGKDVYIAFGSNQGDSIQNIRGSIAALKQAGVIVLQTSAIYTSEPLYYGDQPRFYNGVFRCSTDLKPIELLKRLKDIEYGIYGRIKKMDNGPRTMDLDILLYGDEVVDLPELKIPHVDMLNRSFVMKPLNDVVPGSTADEPAFPEERSLDGSERLVIPLHRNSVHVPEILEIGKETILMSIMNATKDSFSDGGDLWCNNVHAMAVRHLNAGADILDIGGQSTRPGAEWIGNEKEAENVCDVIREIRSHEDTRNAIVSVDTCWADVAEAALSAGANIINDVYSGVLDPGILAIAARTGAPIKLSHSRGDPTTMGGLTDYPHGVVDGVANELRERIDAALDAGCKSWQLILDPGLGFAKTAEQNIELIRKFSVLKHHPALTNGLPLLPWLVGPSRKGFIGQLTGESEAKNRLIGTISSLTALSQQGAEIVRVHDTRQAWQALKVADAIYK